MKTENEINCIAAEAMGIHCCTDFRIAVAMNPAILCKANHWTCSKCNDGRTKCDADYIAPQIPDFVNDLNAAQRLMKFAIDQRAEVVIEVCLDAFVNLYSVCNILTASPKTIALAALVALGKISPEEAKECLG